MFGLGPAELIIIAVIVLLIFGARRLPDIGKGLGGAIKEFRNVKKELGQDRTAGKDQDKVVDKVLEQVPGVKKVAEIKKKADKIKEIM